jgi:hypothetical protein
MCAGAPLGDVQVVVQLSPGVIPDPFERCVDFSFYENCVTQPLDCPLVIQFGPPLAPGVGAGTIVPGAACPIERVFAVTARDPLHSLRATAELACLGPDLVASFEADPQDSGHWLTGGNLDALDPDVSWGDANTINIVDFAIFYCEYRKGTMYLSGDTTCGTPWPHADLNADGCVDVLDYNMLAGNFTAASEFGPCGWRIAAGAAPLTEISAKELRRQGRSNLAIADINRDGWVDAKDMALFRGSDQPAVREKTGREGLEVGRQTRGR